MQNNRRMGDLGMLLSASKHALIFHVLENHWYSLLWVRACVFAKSLSIKQRGRMRRTPNKATSPYRGSYLTLTV